MRRAQSNCGTIAAIIKIEVMQLMFILVNCGGKRKRQNYASVNDVKLPSSLMRRRTVIDWHWRRVGDNVMSYLAARRKAPITRGQGRDSMARRFCDTCHRFTNSATAVASPLMSYERLALEIKFARHWIPPQIPIAKKRGNATNVCFS